jgi:hypothetical protein
MTYNKRNWHNVHGNTADAPEKGVAGCESLTYEFLEGNGGKKKGRFS